MHEDTRFVNGWELRLDGRPLALLKSAAVDYDSAAFFLTNPETPRLRAHSVVASPALAGGGVLEQIEVFNTASSRSAASCASSAQLTSPICSRSRAASGRPQRQHRRERRRRRARPALPLPGARLPRRDDDRDAAAASSTAPRRTSSPRRVQIEGMTSPWVELPPRCSFLTVLRVGVRVNSVAFEPAAGFGDRHSRSRGRRAAGSSGFHASRRRARCSPVCSGSRSSTSRRCALPATSGRGLRPSGSRAPVVHDAFRPGHADHVPADALGRPSGLHAARCTCSARR